LTSRRLVPFGILSRYVGRSLVRPFLLGFSVVTFLLTLEMLIDYLDLILGKGIAAWMVGKLFVLGLGWMVVLSVPCGVLVAALMAFGQMSQDNEITALRASGINLFSAMVPAIVISVLVAVALALFNNYILPDTNHAFANLVTDINRIRPTAHIQEGVFIDDFEGYNLFIRKLNDRTGEMRDVLIIDATQNRSSPRTIVANEGELRFLPDQNAISLDLRSGEIHEADPNDPTGRYHRLAFNEEVMVLSGATQALARASARSRGDREMSVELMNREIENLRVDLRTTQTQIDSSLARIGLKSVRDLPDIHPEKQKRGLIAKTLAGVAGVLTGRHQRPHSPHDISVDKRRRIEDVEVQLSQLEGIRKRIDRFRVEIQKKFSIPFACIIFVLVGAPLGMRARRGGMAVGFVSVAFFLFYYLCLIGGEQLADRAIMPPWLAMWLPNIVLGLLGARLTYLVTRSGWTIAAGRQKRR